MGRFGEWWLSESLYADLNGGHSVWCDRTGALIGERLTVLPRGSYEDRCRLFRAPAANGSLVVRASYLRWPARALLTRYPCSGYLNHQSRDEKTSIYKPATLGDKTS